MSGTLNKIISLISYEISMVESYFVKEKNQPLPWTSTIHALLVHERLGHDQMGRETETLSLSHSLIPKYVAEKSLSRMVETTIRQTLSSLSSVP